MKDPTTTETTTNSTKRTAVTIFRRKVGVMRERSSTFSRLKFAFSAALTTAASRWSSSIGFVRKFYVCDDICGLRYVFAFCAFSYQYDLNRAVIDGRTHS